MMWGYSHDYILEHGDAWVGITLPASVAGLQKFDPSRYASLSFKNPTPGVACGPSSAVPDIEDGLRWDAISQVGALLKAAKRKWRSRSNLCINCGYDLRATPERCPECGTAVSSSAVQSKG